MVDVILLKTGNMIVPDVIFKLFVDDDRCFQLVPNSTFHQYNGLYCTVLIERLRTHGDTDALVELRT